MKVWHKMIRGCAALGVAWMTTTATAQEPAPKPASAGPNVEALLKRLEEAENKIKKLEAIQAVDETPMSAGGVAEEGKDSVANRLKKLEDDARKKKEAEEQKKFEEEIKKMQEAPDAPTTPRDEMWNSKKNKSKKGKCDDEHGHLHDSLHDDDEEYGLKSLFDSLHPFGEKGKKWYEKLTLRGYTQFRYDRTLETDPTGAEPNLLADRSINGVAENFLIRRARLILQGDVSDHLGIYIQPDFAVTPPGSSSATFFTQLRDLYADVYLTKDKVHRVRVGLSKVPFGWENLQSSQNRIPLDRTDAINTAVSPNERDLGAFYYYTPESKQKLFRELVEGGLKGSGNYGIFALGVYNGQGGSNLEQNLMLHAVARATYPFMLNNGQVVEMSVQGYTGDIVVSGSDIRPLGIGDSTTPDGTGGNVGFRDQRVGTTFVWYPQPFGFQCEWNWGEGPGLNDQQTEVQVRALHGGYVMAMYKHDTEHHGIFTPYVRYQHYKGGYRSVANAPFGRHEQLELGLEWQIRKEMELVTEYAIVDGVNLNAIDRDNARSYRNFDGNILRFQFQVNY